MRHFHRVMMLGVMLGLASALAGCENFDLDKLDFLGLNAKKPLPGDRRPVFPEGVPGVTQGIPPEYLRSNVQQQTGSAVDVTQAPPTEPGTAPVAATPANAQTATAEPAEDIKQTGAQPKAAVKPKPKPKPKQRIVKRTQENAPAQAASQDQNAQQQPAPWPAQARAQPASRPTQQSQQAQSPWPEPAQNTMAPWPSAPPPGTFSK